MNGIFQTARGAAMARLLLGLAAFLGAAEAFCAASSPVQITEFAAGGRQGLIDEDGDTPDWIEIQNVSAAAVSLEGWTLGDGSRRRAAWKFPSTNLPPGGFMIILASGKDRSGPGRILHTNFKLGAAKGDIFLAGPGGESSRVENYPPQVAGISFGLPGGTGGGRRQTLIGPGSPVHYQAPAAVRGNAQWIKPGFDDASWLRGRNGIGFASRPDTFRPLLQTDTTQLIARKATGLLLRFPFVLTNSPGAAGLELQAQYDDGFVAWLNGAEVARRNAQSALGRDSTAASNRPDEQGMEWERVPLQHNADALVPGANWLTVHLLNTSIESSDIFFNALLTAPQPDPPSSSAPAAAPFAYLNTPTPGRANAAPAALGPFIAAVEMLPAGRQPAADEPIVVTAKIAPRSGSVAQARLRFRVMGEEELDIEMLDDGQHGDGAAGDGVFAASIPARSAKPGQMVRYCVLASDEAGSVSRWPLFASRKGYSSYLGTVVADPSIETRLPVFHLFSGENRESSGNPGRAVSIFYEGELYDNVAISGHGQISRGFPKPGYNFDFPRDHQLRYRPNQPRVTDIKLLGNYADKSKMRNTLSYEILALAGSVSHFAFPVRVQGNGKFFCVGELVEDADERWLERVGRDPGGALYKMYDNLSGDDSAEKKTRKHEDTRDLLRLASAISENRPLEQRAAYAYDNIDLPQCVSYFAALSILSSGDHGHKNFYVCRDTRVSGEWALFPWDVDLTWGRNWAGHYFDERMLGDNPLNHHRAGQNKGRNRFYSLFFEHPEFRQMYLRRLRTLMDEMLRPPGAAPESLVIEPRIRAWMDRLDPPDVRTSDADLDTARWPSWGERASMRSEAQRIIDEYLPARRNYLYKSSRAALGGERIPAAQPENVAIEIAQAEISGPESFVCLTNRNDFAVDVSGWKLAGAGLEHAFRPGTVILAGKALYVAQDVAAFRRRQEGPSGGQSLFAQGNWKGAAREGELQLSDRAGRAVAAASIKAETAAN